MIRRKTLTFFGVLFLFGAIIASLHFILLISSSTITGYVGAPESSASVLGSFAFLLLAAAFIFFILAVKRYIPCNVVRRIALRNVYAQSAPDFTERHF